METRESPARRPGRGLAVTFGLFAVGLAAAGPDQAVGLAILVLEEVGVDGRREARIVEFEREVVAALVGALRPGGPDLGVLQCAAKRRLCGARRYAEWRCLTAGFAPMLGARHAT